MNPICPNCKSNDNVAYDHRDHSYWCYECDADFKPANAVMQRKKELVEK